MKKIFLLFAFVLTAIHLYADDWGTCGDGLVYEYSTSTQTLTISKAGYGTGEMWEYNITTSAAPWSPYSKNILKLVINEGVRTIETKAFSSCSNLASIEVDEGNTFFDSRSHCNAIIYTSSNELVLGCKSSVIPSGVTSIGDQAFRGSSGLRSITIPNSVKSIGLMAFGGCTGLTSITIGSGVTYIGSQAFDGCTGITSIAIPNSVTTIGILAFQNCSGLTSITIPASVTSIESSFIGCSGLTSIVVDKGNTVYDSRDNCNAIISSNDNELVTGCKRTVIPNSVTSIGVTAFQG